MNRHFAGASVAAMLVAAALVSFSASGRAASGMQAVEADISGVVTSSNGPEEGVWVIAETTSLPTKFVKSVVTGDGGRYLIPDLPDATYDVWVRGYGLVDSDPVTAIPGDTVDLEATVAETPAEAARVYPANYWYSLIRPPATDEFPGTGEDGNGIAANLQHQDQWIDVQKQGCMLCHQLGSRIIREIDNLDQFDSSLEAWDHRVRMGQRGSQMTNVMNRFGRERGLQMFSDWSDRIATGAVPPAPPRPQGVERNVVISMWEWGTEIDYIHDEITTDKRDPTINAGGPVYGVNISNDALAILDPVTHTATSLERPAARRPGHGAGDDRAVDAGAVPVLRGRADLEGPGQPAQPDDGPEGAGLDDLRDPQPRQPGLLQGGLGPSLRAVLPAGHRLPVGGVLRAGPRAVRAGRHLLRDPPPAVRRGRERHALLQRRRAGHRLDRHTALRRDRQRAAFAGLVPDGARHQRRRRDHEAVERAGAARAGGRSTTPALDTRVVVGSYGVIGDPTDEKAVWISSNRFPGRLARLHVGDNPPESCVTEMYEVPSVLDPNVPPDKRGFGSRGLDIDRDGVIWTALSGSSHLASFDRRKCAVHNGPTSAEGRHCVEGWTLYPTPGPTIAGTNPPVRADYHYYNWVDQWDTLGLGRDVPIATGSNSDSLLALDPDTGEWTVLRVPYPQGFFTRGLDGRIDDPNAGWKGRGVWATYGAAATWHIEGGVGVKPGMLKFQVRPHPLAN